MPTANKSALKRRKRLVSNDTFELIRGVILEEEGEGDGDGRNHATKANEVIEVITLDDSSDNNDDDVAVGDGGRDSTATAGNGTTATVDEIERPPSILADIYENAFTPWTASPICLGGGHVSEKADEGEERPSGGQSDDDEFGQFGTPSGTIVGADDNGGRVGGVDETYGDTFAETPSHFDLPDFETPNAEPTESQAAYDLLMGSVKSSVDHLCVLSLEILALSNEPEVRAVAEPKRDFVWAVFYAIDEDVCNRCETAASSSYNLLQNSRRNCQFRGLIALDTLRDVNLVVARQSADVAGESYPQTLAPIFVSHEMQIFAELTNIVQRYDPDILVGYDSTRFSWGYLYERAEFLGLPFLRNISRIRDIRTNRRGGGECSPPPHGRIQLEVWRVARREDSALRCYRLASVVRALLKRTFPDLSAKWIGRAVADARKRNVHGVIDTILRHFLAKCELNIEILDALDVFVKTSQMARVYGIQFLEVLTRGSQFRVESILLRLAARRKFVAPSISALQRNLMGSPETIPLNLEPESGVYYDPVVVLDFQSLYPSVCIAYNYCFTTCLGKLARLKALAANYEANPVADGTLGTMTLGALTNYEPADAQRLANWLAADALNISPTGGVFLKATERPALLAQMLGELLDARVMVKKAMKAHRNCEALTRLLDARQLALKLVANVTYGYTAANWSGRMPCEELADAIVAKGRETLERAIKHIHEHSSPDGEAKYANARVIYGDTDSVFVLFEGRSRADAFRLGEQIAADVSAQNPYPMKLKFEKVLQPCALVTKKRYVGMAYESVAQTCAIFDAKGIETVRRDSCGFVAKTVENALRLLFEARPLRDAGGMFSGGGLETALRYLKFRLRGLREIPPAEFVLSAEYRERYAERAVLPVKKIAEAMAAKGERHAALRGERVSYVIAVNSADAAALRAISRGGTMAAGGGVTAHAVAVDDFLANTALELHFDYYVTRQLFPALSRFFQFFAVRLNWRAGAALRTFCLACSRARKYPFCKRCLKSCTNIVLRRVVQQRELACCRRVCRECIGASAAADHHKSVGNIEDALSFSRCANVACANRQRLALVERRLRPAEFRRHIQEIKLAAVSDF